MTRIKKAVIPVAGKGTRIMPLTLHQPKGMVGVVDKPIIHYVIDEALGAGVKEIIIIKGPNQNHFQKYLSFLKSDPEWKKVKFTITTQRKALGNGHVLLSAKRYVENEPFLLLFGDDILAPQKNLKPPMKTLVNFYNKFSSPILALQAVPDDIVSRMGVVDAKKIRGIKNLFKINDMVEKPPLEEAPSNLTVVGRYVVTPDIIQNVETLFKKGLFSPRGEIEITDAFKMRLQQGKNIYGWEFPHERLDCGSQLGLLKAQVRLGMHHEKFKTELKKYIKPLVS